MFMSFSKHLLRRVSCRIIRRNKNSTSFFQTSNSSIYLKKRGLPNLKIYHAVLPRKYSTAYIQIIESDKKPKKTFLSYEYYRKMLENDPACHGLLFCLENVKKENESSDNNILLASRELMKNYDEDISLVNEGKVINLKRLIDDERRWLKYYELAEVVHNVLKCLVINSNESFQNHLLETIQFLDTECIERISHKAISEQIFLADLWFQYHKTLFNVNDIKFVFKMKWKLYDWINRLSKAQMLMFLHFLSVAKYPPKTNDDFGYYLKMEKMIPSFTIEEIGLLCFALENIKRHLVAQDSVNLIIGKLLEEELQSINHTSLTWIAKSLTAAISFDNEIIYSLQQKFAADGERFPVHMLLNFLVITTKTVFRADNNLVQAILRRSKEDFTNLNYSCLYRLLQALSVLNVRDEELFQLIEEKLRSEEKVNLPRFLGIVRLLIVFNVFLDDVISKILSEESYETISKMKSSSVELRDLVFIEMSMAIERPNFQHFRIDEKKRKRLLHAIRFKVLNNRRATSGSLLYWLEECLTRIYGSDRCFQFFSVLPHFGCDGIVLKLDKNLQGQDIPESWKADIVPYDALRPPDKDHYWLVINTLKKFYYTEDGDFNAEAACMERQLKALGFLPIPIRSIEYTRLKTDQLRDEFIKNKIKEGIENVVKTDSTVENSLFCSGA